MNNYYFNLKEAGLLLYFYNTKTGAREMDTVTRVWNLNEVVCFSYGKDLYASIFTSVEKHF